MNTDKRDIVTQPHGLAMLARAGADSRQQQPAADESGSNLLALSRSVVASDQLGVISERELKHIVTAQFAYPAVRREFSGLSENLVAALTPFSAKGRALRYLAARILLESASERPLCFSVSGAERKCGATYIAANLAVAFSEFGLRTLLIDANHARPHLHKMFSCEQTDGLSTLSEVNDLPGCFVVRLRPFRDLSLLPAGKTTNGSDRRLMNETLVRRLSLVRPNYDVVICDSPAHSAANDNCEVVAGICGSALSVFRKNHTRVSKARALLGSLDSVGARPIGSVLCDF
jgi:protein-tyrosine kinase